MTYEVIIDDKEKMEIFVISSENILVKTYGGAGFKKEHGYTHMNYKGLCDLIEKLNEIKEDIDNL